jgi:hypothetical protein
MLCFVKHYYSVVCSILIGVCSIFYHKQIQGFSEKLNGFKKNGIVGWTFEKNVENTGG